ncbi:hypothetical protein GW17_00057618, partial [Ensete ventricosum]
GGRLRPGPARNGRHLQAEAPPVRAATTRGYGRLRPTRRGDNRTRHSRLQRGACKVGPVVGRSQGAAARGQPYR